MLPSILILIVVRWVSSEKVEKEEMTALLAKEIISSKMFYVRNIWYVQILLLLRTWMV